ncbi:hypothetical protein FACS1894181_12400 [Bacteroidia bacterium]|nr:hypothetical protein FACS1894181_12400 [Bacteroidia bacterium]
MKYIKYILSLLVISLAGLSSCETYGKYEIEYSSIHPLSGMYRITIVDEAGTEVLRNYVQVYNTEDESKTQCWIRVAALTTAATNGYSICGKINCDVNALTFSGENIGNYAGNVAATTTTFSLTGGKVVLAGATAPSGTVTDAISFAFTNSRFPGKTYTATGYRYTGWAED